MKKHIFTSVMTGAALLLAGAAQTQAPVAPSGPRLHEYYADPAHADIGGFWRLAAEPVFMVDGKALPPRNALNQQMGFPYKPAWRRVVAARYASQAKGLPYGDPNDSCWPAGTFNDYIVDKDRNGFELVQTVGRVELLFEYQGTIRWIYSDGRPHAAGDDLLYTVKGDSIGRWEGDSFVADTIGVRYELVFGYNLPHSDQVHFVERFHRVDPETLQIDVTITDPVALTKPVTTTLTFKKSDPATIREKLCLEENWHKIVDPDLIVRPDPRVKVPYGFDLPAVR